MAAWACPIDQTSRRKKGRKIHSAMRIRSDFMRRDGHFLYFKMSVRNMQSVRENCQKLYDNIINHDKLCDRFNIINAEFVCMCVCER